MEKLVLLSLKQSKESTELNSETATLPLQEDVPFEDGRLRITVLFASQGRIVTQSTLAQKVYCRSLKHSRLTAPEHVSWHLKENTDDAPATTEDKVA